MMWTTLHGGAAVRSAAAATLCKTSTLFLVAAHLLATGGLVAQDSLPIALPTAATIFTDQPDYAPGSTAYISGEGFEPGESVTCQVLHADVSRAWGSHLNI